MDNHLSGVNLIIILILLLSVPLSYETQSPNLVNSDGKYNVNIGDSMRYNITKANFHFVSQIIFNFGSQILDNLTVNTSLTLKVLNKTTTKDGLPQAFINISIHRPNSEHDIKFEMNNTKEFLNPCFTKINDFQSYINNSIQTFNSQLPISGYFSSVGPGGANINQTLIELTRSGNYYITIIKTILPGTTFTDISKINLKSGWLEDLNETGTYKNGTVFSELYISRIYSISFLSQYSDIINLGTEFILAMILIGVLVLVISFSSYRKNSTQKQNFSSFKNYLKAKLNLKLRPKKKEEIHAEKALEMLEEILHESTTKK